MKLNKIEFKYKPKQTSSGDLRTPVTFFDYKPKDGPDPEETEKSTLHKCHAEIYSPSMKDLEKLKSSETKQALTIKIRDSKGEYVPSNKHFVEINDYRYRGITWNIIDVVFDMTDNSFIKLILGVIN